MEKFMFVYGADQFDFVKFLARLKGLGYKTEDLLFDDTRDRFKDSLAPEVKVPTDVLKETHKNLELCLCAARGVGAGDGVLEDPRPGACVVVYDATKLRESRMISVNPIPGDVQAPFYYAKNASQLEQALLGVVKFV